MTTMKAVRAHRRGGPEQLVLEVAPRPTPAAGEVLVAVHAASITRDELTWDATWTDSMLPGGNDRTPIVPSHEMSGVVVEVGAGVRDLSAGDAVCASIPFVRDGAAAEYVVVPAGVIAAKPSAVDHVAAAAVPLAGLTARQALVDHAHVDPWAARARPRSCRISGPTSSRSCVWPSSARSATSIRGAVSSSAMRSRA